MTIRDRDNSHYLLAKPKTPFTAGIVVSLFFVLFRKHRISQSLYSLLMRSYIIASFSFVKGRVQKRKEFVVGCSAEYANSSAPAFKNLFGYTNIRLLFFHLERFS